MAAPHNLRTVLLALLTTLALAVPALAQTFPPLAGRVVDAAQVLGPSPRAELAARLRALEAQTSHQLVIATVPSLNGHTVEDYANRLFRAWGLGGKDRNDGVLLLVAPTERKLRIEVGYGLEGELPDAIAKVIIEEFMVPKLRAGRIDAAVTAGVDKITDVISGRGAEIRQIAQARAAPASHDRSSTSSVPWGVMMFFALIPVLVMVGIFFPSPARRQRPSLPRGQYCDFDRSSLFAPISSGSSGGSSSDSSSNSSSSSSDSSDSFSGGGGSSGGGGASGSW
jgi:uncharacterized protein